MPQMWWHWKRTRKPLVAISVFSENKNTSDATQGNLSSTLAPKGYTIPTEAVFEELVNAGNLEVVPQSTSLGGNLQLRAYQDGGFRVAIHLSAYGWILGWREP